MAETITTTTDETGQLAEMESITHTGIVARDLVESESFYELLGGKKMFPRRGFEINKMREGRFAYTEMILGDYVLVLGLPNKTVPMPPEDEQRGCLPFRHGFTIPRQQFVDMPERLRKNGIAFEGPVSHPAEGPFGESIYLQDPGGNFLEFCWRRDEDRVYNPTLIKS